MSACLECTVNVMNDVMSDVVSSGTVTINEDSSVQVLAEEAVPVENLDSNAAREALNRAQQALSSASGDVAKAEAQIAVEVSEALVQASH
jgi:F-type H+-transporting ATPase subunit delta